MAEEEDVDIFQSRLVPKHDVLTEDEKAQFLKAYNITVKQLPRIRVEDAVIKRLAGKKGDVVRIHRNDPAVGSYYYYRVVV